MNTMQDVLRAHWSASTHTESKPFVDKCDYCGAVLREWGDDTDMPTQLAAHQAAALSAAGFGPAREAQAGALEDAADEIDAQRDAANPDRKTDEGWSVIDHCAGRFLGKTVAARLLRARAAAERGGE